HKLRDYFSLLFLLYAIPRDLHSFPTRRSSDLFRVCFSECVRNDSPPPPYSAWRCWLPAAAAPSVHRTSKSVSHSLTSKFCGRKRSEEHTSELQSRENLVCRLLLEKKKNIQCAN